MRLARPSDFSPSRSCAKVAGAPVTTALAISPPAKRTFAVSLASVDSGMVMRTLPLNSQALSLKSSPFATARSAVMRTWPWVIVTASNFSTPFWKSRSCERASSWIGSCSRSCAAAATQAASRATAARLRCEAAIDVGFQAQCSGLEVGAHAERPHPVRAECEFDGRARVGDFGHGVELQARGAQFRGDRVFARLAREPDVALELYGAPARRHARLVCGQVPDAAGRGVVIHCDIGQAHDPARGFLGSRDRLQPDAQLPVGAELLEVDARQEIARTGRVLGECCRLAIDDAPLNHRRDQGHEPREQDEARDHDLSPRAASRKSQNSRTAPRPPAARVTCRAAASTSGCASATAAGNPTAAISPRSGVSSTRQATRRASTALRSRSSARASDLSLAPWVTSSMPSSRMRAATAADRRPEITATATPAALSALMPWPSRTWKALRLSPSGPYHRRPSVSTPSTSRTRSATSAACVTSPPRAAGRAH